MHATEARAEADRLMTICNACRYCEGLCAVFPAMELRREFRDADVDYLANLCHGCGACYHDCQFAPPHEFDVNVPRTFARVRVETYADRAWPAALRGTFERNGLAVGLTLAGSVASFVAGFVVFNDPAALFAANTEPGAFYRLMPHGTMAALFGGVFLYAVLALCFGLRDFWRSIGGGSMDAPAFLQAARDAASLRYLDGGGVGCMNDDDRPTDRRRLYHHLTFYGFALCFAATAVGTLYHYGLGRIAPYPWYDLPGLLGTLGGVGLVVGPLGLLSAKWRRDPALEDEKRRGMDVAFLVLLLLTGATGLALHVLRGTGAMGMLLAIHLGVVFALFATMPYGKFVHGFYRFAALMRHAGERRAARSE